MGTWGEDYGDERAWALLWFQFSDGVECGYGNIEVTILTECFRRLPDHQSELSAGGRKLSFFSR